MLYTFLTGLIILLSKIRDKTFKPHMRFDRTIPHPPDQPKDILWMDCCDCGLPHFFINGVSGTPVRPKEYKYNFRFGAKAWHEPDLELGQEAYKKARELGWCGPGIEKP